MEELVKGVRLLRSDEALMRVAATGIDLQLIASWDGTEVIRQLVPAGKRFGLRPEDGWGSLECLQLLQGEAIWENGARTLRLHPGDSLTGSPVKAPCMLTAVTDLVALYICSNPVFHRISRDLDGFRYLAMAVEEKDDYTAGHCRRIQVLSHRVGQLLNLSPDRQHNLFHGAFFHDLGKVMVPSHILKKPGKLTAQEWTIMKNHTIYGREMVARTALEGTAAILEQHHERLDGSGYPHGLKGDEIHLEAQIVAVVDSYDAMTTDRVYRGAYSQVHAIAELQQGAGRLYRPDVLEAFMSVLQEGPNLTCAV